MDDKQICANCTKPYSEHGEGTQCVSKLGSKWFPQSIADALEKQARRIRRAQRELGKKTRADRGDGGSSGR